MSQVVVDLIVRDGETLTQKIAEIIAIPAVRRRESPAEVLRNMRTEKDHRRWGGYRLTLEYAPVEEEELVGG